MGWFSFGSSGPQSEKAADGGRIAPDRSSREQCYNGRDLFFSCLDRNDIIDAIKNDGEARKKCAKEIAEFESACSKTWVRFSLSLSLCLCVKDANSG
jgi:cytochrome c oxidase assembly factor 6